MITVGPFMHEEQRQLLSQKAKRFAGYGYKIEAGQHTLSPARRSGRLHGRVQLHL
jgi:hypothetical protein